MEMKILYAGAVLFAGWLWFYLFMRQFLFNFITAYPLIKKMNALQSDLIAIGAKRYTTVSVIMCLLVSAIVIGVIVAFCPLYLELSFAGGALVALLMLINRLSPRNRPMFDAFCVTYYKFVPDDELRTAIYNKKTTQIKARLKDMGISGTFIPEFKK